MSGDVQVLSGVLVGAVARAYNGFTDRQTGEQRPGGVTYSAYVSTAFDSAPVEVKITEPAMFGELERAGAGRRISITCQLGARNNQVTRKAVSVEVVSLNGKPEPVPAK